MATRTFVTTRSIAVGESVHTHRLTNNLSNLTWHVEVRVAAVNVVGPIVIRLEDSGDTGSTWAERGVWHVGGIDTDESSLKLRIVALQRDVCVRVSSALAVTLTVSGETV